MRDAFHEELDAIQATLVTMGEMVSVAMSRSSEALLKADVKLAEQVISEDEKLDTMIDVVKEMHTASGLLREVPHGVSMAEANKEVMQYVKQHVPDARKAPLAGSSVYVDRGFLARDLPELDEHLHYRVIDVSSIKELARRWYPKVYFSSPEKTGNHRALADIRESIAELRYYREAIMVAQPGPGSDIAKELANRFVVEHE